MKTQITYQIDNSKIEEFINDLQEIAKINTEKIMLIQRDFWCNIYITCSERKHEIIESLISN